jgi:serine/threonine protein kinase/Tol biopolymer transport system component/tetratricopeptide (TPR) repeat protein
LERALGEAPADREAFVYANGGGDPELCAEVVSLLASHEDARDFLEPVGSVPTGADSREKPQPDLAGVRIGAYRLIREIGHGGMGTVYLAERADQEFSKRVAIKLIRGGKESHFAVSRFRNERQILARLEHPNMARLIDGGTTPEGFPYFVMEYVEGDSFVVYCRSLALPIRKRAEIFQAVCSAVEYAHRRNIIHRDLKPTNILVKSDGTPKLLDFGIAKFVDAESEEGIEATITAFRLMTPAYASPEQLRGAPATVRSDIYTLGAVLWEALTGEIPRGEESIASFDPVKAGIRIEERALVLRLGNVIRKALREYPDNRYGSVDAFADDLRAAAEGGKTTVPEPMPQLTTLVQEAPPCSIAVLPFQLLASDTTSDSYLGAALADAVIIRLSNLGRIVVRPTSSVMRFSPTSDATAVGRELKVRYVLEGRVQKISTRIRVTVQLIAVETGAPVCAASFDETVGDLLKLEDSISAKVADALVPQLTGEERRELARHGTHSAKAHQAYLRGRWHWSRHSEDAMPQALLHFTEAVLEDPKYARAHAGIADYHIALAIRGLMPPTESLAAAIESARHAIALDPRLAEAHASLGLALWVRNRDYASAEHHLQMAITLNPDYAAAHDWFGLRNLACGKPELAALSLERARSLEPASSIFPADLALCHYHERHYAEAVACFEAEEQVPPVVNGSILALSLLARGDTGRALEAARQYALVMSRSPLSLGVLALSEAAAGNTAEPRSLLDELTTRARDYYVSGVALAMANLACGRHRDAVRQLQRATLEGDWWSIYLGSMAVWDPLRGHSGFARLVKRAATGVAPPQFRWTAIAAAALVLAVAALLAYSRFSVPAPPLEGAAISRLTTNGISASAVLSPDGRDVAWTSREGGRLSVWTRHIDNGTRRQIAGPFDGQLLSLAFVRGKEDVAFVVRPVNDPVAASLHIVPLAGGPPRAVISRVPSPLSIAPDESRVAFYRSSGDNDELVVADVDAAHGKLTSGRVVYARRHPDVFTEYPAPAWSPDGRAFASLVRVSAARSHGIELLIVRLDGSARVLDAGPWQNIVDVVWAQQGAGLMLAGQEPQAGFQQIWYVPARGGRPTRITNDLDDYSSLSVAADSSAMAAIQSQIVTNLYVLDPAAKGGPVQITPGGGRYFDVTWTPSGGIVYASDATGTADIWTMESTGGGQRQLTHGPGRSYGPAVSPDGHTVAFHSNRDGIWNIWTVDTAGGEPTRLTNDATESSRARFTADGSAVVYHHLGLNALFSIRRQPLAGGPAQQLTTAHTMFPTVSEDGRLAYWYCENPADPRWTIAVLNPGGAAPAQFFSFPPDRMPREVLRWVPGKNAISYVETRQGVSNIWIQPLDGSPARQFTSFTSGRIYAFDWSRDGRLLYSQGMTTSNVVLMRGRTP